MRNRVSRLCLRYLLQARIYPSNFLGVSNKLNGVYRVDSPFTQYDYSDQRSIAFEESFSLLSVSPSLF